MIEEFKNELSKLGINLSTEQAENIYKQLKQFQKNVKNMSQFDILNMKQCPDMDDDIKDKLIKLMLTIKDI